LLVLAVPLFDLILVIVSRLRRGVNPFTTGGKDHFAHRLVRLGLSHRQAAVAVYLLAIASGLMAWLASRADPDSARLAGLSVGLAALWGVWRLEIIAPPWLLDREI
jgi:UDP-GlcNAc:undecaprenyl-phosphate GlcNAc-1-phosphate transferase